MQRRASGEGQEGGVCCGKCGVQGKTMRLLLLYVESVMLKQGIILYFGTQLKLYFGTQLKQENILTFGPQL